MHLLISGPPGSGKTTFIRTFFQNLTSAAGFYTEEIPGKGERQGFKIKTFSGKEAVFAEKGLESPYKLGAYGLDLKAFETIALDCLEQASVSEAEIVIIDEIGKMELNSKQFQKAVGRVLERKKVIAAVPDKYEHSFLTALKKRKDVCLLKIRRDNTEQVREIAQLWVKALECAQIKALDRKAIALGLSEVLLIENAASNLAGFVQTVAEDKELLFISGRGNNGADVLSCCRKLYCRGYKVKAVIVSDKELNQEAGFQRGLLEKFFSLTVIGKEEDTALLKNLCGQADLIVEGLIGTGIRGKADGLYAQAIEIINQSGKKVVACDIPSGLLPDQGYSGGPTVKADWTVTFLAPKKGFFLNRGQDFCGKIILTDIGVSRSALMQLR